MVARLEPTKETWLNPDVLKWAREWRGRTLEEAAKRIHKQPDDIAAWERGDKVPTVRQARDLVAFYGRPFVELMLPEPPQLPPSVAVVDFRTHRAKPEPPDSWDLRHLVDWIATQRTNALDLFEEIGEEPTPFPAELLANVNDDPELKAALARDTLVFSIEEQLRLTSNQARGLPGLLRERFERIGLLVLRHPELATLDVRGVCLAEFPLPTIAYTRESPNAQAFSLAHELAHILLRQSGISGPVNDIGATERWANRFAAAFLMPRSVVIERLGAPPPRPAAEFDDGLVKATSRALRVSEHALTVRLVDLGYVTSDFYWQVKRPLYLQQEADWEGGGGPSEYYGSRYRSRQGDLYTGLVLEAWAMDRITNHTAARFMGIKNLAHLDDIRHHFGGA